MEIRNDVLYDEIMACKKNDRVMSVKLFEMMLQITDKYIGHKSYFHLTTFRTPMVAYVMDVLTKSWYHYKPNKNSTLNPFGYILGLVDTTARRYIAYEQVKKDIDAI